MLKFLIGIVFFILCSNHRCNSLDLDTDNELYVDMAIVFIEQFKDDINGLKNTSCKLQMGQIFMGILSGDEWALKCKF